MTTNHKKSSPVTILPWDGEGAVTLTNGKMRTYIMVEDDYDPEKHYELYPVLSVYLENLLTATQAPQGYLAGLGECLLLCSLWNKKINFVRNVLYNDDDVESYRLHPHDIGHLQLLCQNRLKYAFLDALNGQICEAIKDKLENWEKIVESNNDFLKKFHNDKVSTHEKEVRCFPNKYSSNL